MTELAIYRAAESGVQALQDRAVARLSDWAHSASAAYQLAEKLVDSAFVPAQYRGKPMDACAAILSGTEVGLSPMASLRAFDIIQGTAAPKAITLRAIVQSYGHEMVLIESSATRCRMKGRRRGAEEWQSVTWTTDRARELGLMGKDAWKKQPIAMLVARATSELARLIAADAILGIGYTAEEVRDGVDAEQVVDDAPTAVEAPQEPPRKLAYKRGTAEPEPTAEVPVDDAPSEEQRRLMFALLGELDIKDRDKYLALASWHTHRELTSTTEMSRAEVSRFIDYLTERRNAEVPTLEPPDDGPLVPQDTLA